TTHAFGLASSIFPAMDQLAREAKTIEAKTQRIQSGGYVGNVGDRIELPVRVDYTNTFEKQIPNVGTTNVYFFVFADKDGNSLKWYGSGIPEFDACSETTGRSHRTQQMVRGGLYIIRATVKE